MSNERGVRHAVRLLALATALVVGGGCSSNAEEARSPAQAASDLERTRCDGMDEAALAPILAPKTIETVEPQYAGTASGKAEGGRRLVGATMTLRPMPGVTPEWLDRALECHSARHLLGQTTHDAACPYYLPGTTVDIEVQPARDALRVTVQGKSAADAEEIVARAKLAARTPQ